MNQKTKTDLLPTKTVFYIEALHPFGKWEKIDIFPTVQLGGTKGHGFYYSLPVYPRNLVTFQKAEEAKPVLKSLRKGHRNDSFRIVKVETTAYSW